VNVTPGTPIFPPSLSRHQHVPDPTPPDKRTLFFDEAKEKLICVALKAHLRKLWRRTGIEQHKFVLQSAPASQERQQESPGVSSPGPAEQPEASPEKPDVLVNASAFSQTWISAEAQELLDDALSTVQERAEPETRLSETPSRHRFQHLMHGSSDASKKRKKFAPAIMSSNVELRNGDEPAGRDKPRANLTSSAEIASTASPAPAQTSDPPKKRPRLQFGKAGTVAARMECPTPIPNAAPEPAEPVPFDGIELFSDESCLADDQDEEFVAMTDAELPPLAPPEVLPVPVANPSEAEIASFLAFHDDTPPSGSGVQVGQSAPSLDRSLSEIFCTKQSLASMRVLGQVIFSRLFFDVRCRFWIFTLRSV
jgi:hypothetical protein